MQQKFRLNEYYFDDAALYVKIYVKIRTKKLLRAT